MTKSQRGRGRPSKQPQKRLSKAIRNQAAMVHKGINHDKVSAGHCLDPESPEVQMMIDEKVKTLEVVTAFIASNIKAFEVWLKTFGEEDANSLKPIENICSTIANMMRIHRSGAETNTTNTDDHRSSQFAICRSGQKTIQILAPINEFTSLINIEKKTFGFVRDNGQDWPSMYAISGTRPCIQNQQVLDNVLWSRLSLEYAERNGLKPKSNGWESCQGSEKGLTFAGHAERKLMLWFVSDMFRQHTGNVESMDIQFKKLHELNGRPGAGTPIIVDIIINRNPCNSCKEFSKSLENVIWGLKFKFILIPTLGKLELEYDSSKNQFFPLVSKELFPGREDSENEDHTPEAIKVPSRRSYQSVVTSRHGTHLSERVSSDLLRTSHPPQATRAHQSPQERDHEIIETNKPIKLRRDIEVRLPRQSSMVEETVTTTSTTSKKIQKRKLNDFAYQNSLTNSKHSRFQSDDESDYGESNIKTSRSKKKMILPDTPPSSARNLFADFQRNPFKAKTLAEAELIKTKKRKEREVSPSVLGHYRRTRIA